MANWLTRIALIISDFIAINIGFLLIFVLRFNSGIYSNDIQLLWVEFSFPAIAMAIYWMGLFLFNGFYKTSRIVSRSDEIFNIIKYISIGIFLLYLITVDLDNPVTFGKSILIFYAISMMIFIGMGRIAIRSYHRKRLGQGKGLSCTIIVGVNRRGIELAHDMLNHPLSGYKPVGFIDVKEEGSDLIPSELPILGTLEDIEMIISEYKVDEIILALEKRQHEKALEIINLLTGTKVGLKSSPDMYDAISGLARTQQLYGMPLIDLMPEFMPLWEQAVKRIIDIVVSLLALSVLSPFLLIVTILIKLDSKGPIFFIQERVGKNNKPYNVIKFRSMVMDAEAETGAVFAQKNDTRVTKLGRLLRFTRIDEIPQFINVLKNEMSVVGPRPERPVFVKQITELYPLYPRRHRVKPGITGWAQVKHSYDTSIEEVRHKLKYDLFYLENISLRLDFKIMVYTVYVMFTGKGSHY